MKPASEQSTARLRAGLADQQLPCAFQPELFFEPDTSTPTGGESRAAKKRRERSARALCLACPARPLCLELALRERPAAGIWAGFNFDEINQHINREAA